MPLVLQSLFPADGAQFVPINAAVKLEFNQDAKANKAVRFRCPDCALTIVSLPALCEQQTCVIENPNRWEAGRTYYMELDATTFEAKWENSFYQPTARYPSFTTAEALCNMEFVTEGWNSNCNCINTGSHCQCNCGSTAILKAF